MSGFIASQDIVLIAIYKKTLLQIRYKKKSMSVNVCLC